ncbi:MAG: hypothetical protein ACOZNI_20015 [Myxococcota bacterium]
MDVEAEALGRRDDAEENGPASAALRASGEQRVEAQTGEVLERAFARVVVDGAGGSDMP